MISSQTLLLTDDGLKKCDIVDKLVSLDGIITCRIKNQTLPFPLIRIEYDTGHIDCTRDQKFMLGDDWVCASKLGYGDEIDGYECKHKIISIEPIMTGNVMSISTNDHYFACCSGESVMLKS